MKEHASLTDLSLNELFSPILDSMQEYGLTRLVAFPGSVTGDGLGGMGSLDLDWQEEIHEEILSLLEEPVFLDNGAMLEAVAGHVVLRLEPDVNRGLPQLVDSGMLSQLASDFLSASLVLGKNIVLTGPDFATIPLCTALLADGERPALMGLDGMLAPSHWPILADLGEVHTLGPDRLGIWCCPTETVAEIMCGGTAVIGCVPGGTRDKALRRMGMALDGVLTPGFQHEPEGVLGAVDLVISLGWNDGFRIQEIVEILPGIGELKHRVLFHAPVENDGHALVPVYRPSYLDTFLNLGLGAYVEKLRAATEEAEHTMPLHRPEVELPDVYKVKSALEPEYTDNSENDAQIVASPQVEVDLSRTMPHRPTYSPDTIDSDAEPPGWELDQLGEEVATDPVASSSSEEALMAAAYGLAPPPRPSGVSADSNPNFQQALEQARVRDEAFRRQQEDFGSDE